jgi:hypothetical protein
MAEDKKDGKKPAELREGVIKYTRPPENKTPPSQRSSEKPKP